MICEMKRMLVKVTGIKFIPGKLFLDTTFLHHSGLLTSRFLHYIKCWTVFSGISFHHVNLILMFSENLESPGIASIFVSKFFNSDFQRSVVFCPVCVLGHHMVLCRSSNNTNRTSWKLSSLSELGYHSNRKTSYQRHLSVFKTSYVCNYVFSTFRCKHSFSFLGFLVVRYHNRSWSNSSIYHQNWRSLVPWALRCYLSRIYEQNSKMDRHTEIKERMIGRA